MHEEEQLGFLEAVAIVAIVPIIGLIIKYVVGL